jgi:mRNA-degrading endonuclease RelE of RelBE toxin-antitoxin system
MPIYVSDKVFGVAKLLEQYPMIHADLKKLGKGIYKMRIGSYRLIFKVYEEQDLIVIVEVEIR